MVWLPWSPPHVGTKGIPPPGAPCFGGCWRETLLSPHQPEEALVSLSVTVSAARRHPLPGRVDFTSAPLVHRTHGVIRVSSVAVWLFTQPPGCCCFVSLSLCVSRLLPNSTSYTQKRASEPVRLVAFAVFSSPPFMRRPGSSSSSSRLAVIVRSASETRCSPPTERRSLSLPPPRPPPRRPMERRGGRRERGSDDMSLVWDRRPASHTAAEQTEEYGGLKVPKLIK